MSAATLYANAPTWAQSAMLNLYAVRISQHRYGAPYREALQRLRESERWPAERLAAYQDERVRAIVEHAYRNSRYYREIMDERGIRPQEIRGTADLPRLPVLPKEVLRARLDDVLTAPKPRRGWLHGHTSGTTGSPLSLWYDRNTCVINNAVDGRQKAWGGMRDGDWIGMFLGRTLVPTKQEEPPFWRANHVHRQVWFSSFHMADDNLPLYIEEIRRRGIRFVEGYPSTLYIVARYLAREGIRLPMKAVFSSSETLHAMQRETIEEAFGCKLFDFYGHAERAIFAIECEQHDGKHLCEEYGYTEVVDENDQPVPDGQPGYMVGTSLHNMAMPMLRYRTGDISAIVREPCACGRTLARIQNVATKAEDIVLTPDGRMISPSILTHPFKPFPQILKSQMIQDRLDHLLVKIVPSDEFTQEHQAQLVASLAERLGPEVKIEVEVHEDIPREKSGKFRWIISRVDHGCTVQWE